MNLGRCIAGTQHCVMQCNMITATAMGTSFSPPSSPDLEKILKKAVATGQYTLEER